MKTIAALFFLAATLCSGQTKRWDRRFGGTLDDSGQIVVPTSDGGYLCGGSSASAANGDKSQNSRGGVDYWVVKIDDAGAKEWDKCFGGDQNDYLSDLQQTADGGYILAGFSDSGATGDKSEGSRGEMDYWVVKINAVGDMRWNKRFGGSGSDLCGTVIQTRDGGYLLGGHSWSPRSGDKRQDSRGGTDYWLVKIDADGARQWDLRFGGEAAEFFGDLKQTADFGYIVGGTSESGVGGDKTQLSRGGDDFWVVKLTSGGVKEWDRTFGGLGHDGLESLQQTTDGGYILGGHSDSGATGDKSQNSRGGIDYWIVKTDATGAKEWDRRFGGDQMDSFMDLRPTSDGGYILGGRSSSGVAGDKTVAGRGLFDYWLVKINPHGRKRWDRCFGGAGMEYLQSIRPTSDGGYILGGSSTSGLEGDKSQSSRGGWDYWLVKVSCRLPDAYEPDDAQDAAQTIANSRTQNRSVHEPGDEDWAQFWIGGIGAENVRVETAGAAGYDTEMWLIRRSGLAQVAYDDDSGAGAFSRISFASLIPGTYLVRARNFNNAGAIPAYTLRASWTTVAGTGDAYEPDNVSTAAKVIANGQTQTRNLHAAGETDWAKFTVSPPGAANVRLQTAGASGDTQMWLYRANAAGTGAGTLLASNNDGGVGDFSRIDRAALPAGRYFVRIQEYGNNGMIPVYTLKATWTSP